MDNRKKHNSRMEQKQMSRLFRVIHQSQKGSKLYSMELKLSYWRMSVAKKQLSVKEAHRKESKLSCFITQCTTVQGAESSHRCLSSFTEKWTRIRRFLKLLASWLTRKKTCSQSITLRCPGLPYHTETSEFGQCKRNSPSKAFPSSLCSTQRPERQSTRMQSTLSPS